MNEMTALALFLLLAAVHSACGQECSAEAHDAHDEALADILRSTKFVDTSWPALRSSDEYGFQHCFVSPYALSRFEEQWLESTSSDSLARILSDAALSLEASDVLLLLFTRTPVLRWHVVVTRSHFIVRSSAMAGPYGVLWTDILRFEGSKSPPRHYTVRAKPRSVRLFDSSANGAERYDALGPFEERLLLPAAVVNLLERIHKRFRDIQAAE